MNIEIAEYRIHIGLHYCKHFKVKGLSHFTDFEILTFLSMLLLNCGDIEKNPGPLSEYSTPSVSSTSSANDSSIKDKFSLVHYNVQSLTEKKDIIFSELSDFSVISITETWFDQRNSDSDIALEGYITYRRDRGGENPGGGVCVYVTDTIFSKRRQDLELPNIECVWVEIKSHSRKLLIGTFYRPPRSPVATFNAIEDSIGMAIDTNAYEILVTGDFNINMADDRSNTKIKNLCQEYNLSQLISDSTHFTEISQSTIDLILTNKSETILTSGVGEPFLDTRTYATTAPYSAFLTLTNRKLIKSFKRHIWGYLIKEIIRHCQPN